MARVSECEPRYARRWRGISEEAMEERENNCCKEYDSSCVEAVAAASSILSTSPSAHGAPPH